MNTDIGITGSMPLADSVADNGLRIVYDGECPFCSRFALLYRLREQVRNVQLIDARSADPIVAEIRQLGYDLDKGMVVKWGGHYIHGAAAMNVMALLGSSNSLFGGVNRLLFRNPKAAKAIYPFLAFIRGMTLKLLGRRLIGDGATHPMA